MFGKHRDLFAKEPEYIQAGPEHFVSCHLCGEGGEYQSAEKMLEVRDLKVYFEVKKSLASSLFGKPQVLKAVDGVTRL